jgi:hypothetical protein
MYDDVNLVCPPSGSHRRFAVNLADDVSEAFDAYMISHDVSDTDVAERAITMLHAIDARLTVGTRIVAFKVGWLGRRRCIELVFNFEPLADATPNHVRGTPGMPASSPRAFRRLNVVVGHDTALMLRAHMAKYDVSVTEAARRAVVTLLAIDGFLSGGRRIGLLRRRFGQLELVELAFTFDDSGTCACTALEPLVWRRGSRWRRRRSDQVQRVAAKRGRDWW